MKLEVTYMGFESNWDFVESVDIVSDKNSLSFHDGEPEDNNLGRNFSDVYSIVELVKEAYEAGFNAEEFEINIVNVESQEKAEELGLW